MYLWSYDLYLPFATTPGIDAKYIQLADSAVTRRRLSSTDLQVSILVDDGGVMAAKLDALMADGQFWDGVNEELAAEGIEGSIDATGATANTATPTCNEYFEFDNVTGTCVAVSIVCQRHTYATLEGGCTKCPAGECSHICGQASKCLTTNPTIRLLPE